MDLNKPLEFNTPNPPPNVNTFMQVPNPSMPQYHLPVSEVDGGVNLNIDHAMRSRVQHELQRFWSQKMLEIHMSTEFKGQNQLPLSRIRKIMKSNKDVKMISAEATILFAKACELLIEELTIRAWLVKDCSKRRTLHRCDIARAIRQHEVFDFLIDLVPFVDQKDNKSEKRSNEAEVHPANQVAFPIIDINDDNQHPHVTEMRAFKGKKIA